MKYKVGDKFLQDIEVARIVENDTCPYKMLPDGGGWSESALDELSRPDDMTAEEAWEIAKKITCPKTFGGFSADDAENIFGTFSNFDIMSRFTPQQVKAKIEAWEAERDIKVGDIVKGGVDQPGIVAFIDGLEVTVMWLDGSCSEKHKNDIKKTGKHIDIQELLEQIGGVE